MTEIDHYPAGSGDPTPPDEPGAGAGTRTPGVGGAPEPRGVPDVELPPVPDHVPVDDDIADMYERAARRRERVAARGVRSGRAWWPPLVGALFIVLVLCGTAWAVIGLIGGSLVPAPVVTAPPEDGAPVAVATATVEATESMAPTTPVESAEPTEPTDVANAVAVYALRYPDAPQVEPTVIKSLKPKSKYVAITIDDGIPFDERMLTLFEENGVHSTAFVLGTFARSRPDLMKRMVDNGWEIANHTWDHKNLKNLSEAKLRAELSKTQEAISAITGNQAPYMRPPGGAYDKRVEKIAASMGYRIVMWNRSLADTSSSATTEQLYRNAVNGVKPGDIILCHWSRPHTYEAMRRILPELKRRGFTVVTLSELIADSGGVEALP